MIKKYLFLCLIVVLLISGCVQTQAEKVGWDQTRYEEYSAFYDNISSQCGSSCKQTDVSRVIYLIDNKLDTFLTEKNDFGGTWYLVFLNYKRGLEARRTYLNIAENCWKSDLLCPDRNAEKSRASNANAYFRTSREYLQKIEDMKMNLSR